MSARLVITAQKGHADISKRLLTVSITGHRWNKLTLDDIPHAEAELRRVFGILEHGVQNLGRVHPDREGSIWLLSGLAEGADQLAFQVAPETWRLAAILPFPTDRYMLDFAPERATGGIDRRSELAGALARADVIMELTEPLDAGLAYEAAGHRMLTSSDVLIAIWDGKKGAGRGGTESIIEKAMETMPVVWIPSIASSPSRLLVTADDLRDRERARPATADAVRRQIDGILALPAKPIAFAA